VDGINKRKSNSSATKTQRHKEKIWMIKLYEKEKNQYMKNCRCSIYHLLKMALNENIIILVSS